MISKNVYTLSVPHTTLTRRMRRLSSVALALGVVAIVSGCEKSFCPSGTTEAGRDGIERYCVESGTTVRHGPFVEWWPNTTPPQKKRAGSYAHGELDGPWNTWFPNGLDDRAVIYRAGKLHGLSLAYNNKGRKREEGEMRDGIRVGTWTLWYEIGTVQRVVEYFQDSKEQRWTNFSAEGKKVQSGIFINGYKEGRAVEYDAEGNKAVEGDYLKSKKNGPWIYFGPDGKEIRREQWNNGVLEEPEQAAK